MKSARYPGVRPFETFQKDFFFGRDRDVADLHDLVMLQKMVVLFARSGYGKSSLINAGLIPMLQSEKAETQYRYIPLVVRPGSYVEGQAMLTLDERVRHELTQKAPKVTAPFLDALCEQKTLWYYFKQRHSAEQERFVLIFDQFEEFFTHPLEQQERFNAELSELLYESIPQGVRSALRQAAQDTPEYQKAAEERLEFLARPMDIKAVFAIRGDRLSLLDRMKAKLPAIFSSRFELKALNREQAMAAIVQPAKLPKNIQREGRKLEFTSPSFEYDKNALDQILDQLSEGRSNQEARIEAFQLQIVCTWIEEEARAGRIHDRDGNGLPDVMAEDLPVFAKIFESYYKQQLEKLTPAEQKVARMVIEDELLFVNSVTGECRRLSVDKDVLLDEYSEKKLTEALLLSLENTFLLRRESNTLGGHSLEISHDALIEPIAKAKKERLEEDERKLALERAEQERKEADARANEAEEKAIAEAIRRTEAERLQHEAEEQKRLAEKRQLEAQEMRVIADQQKLEAQEMRAIADQQKNDAELQRNLAEKRRKSSRKLTIIALCLALVVGTLGIWAWYIAGVSEERRVNVEIANAERDLMEFRQFMADGDELYAGTYFVSALEKYLKADTLSQRNYDNQKFQLATQSLPNKIQECKSKLQNK